MKQALFILLLLLSKAYAQNKLDNTIIIKDTSIAIRTVKNALVKEGFPIDKADSDYVSTGIINVKGYGQKIDVLKDGDSIMLKTFIRSGGTFLGVTDNELTRVSWIGATGGGYKVAFAYLKKIALSLTNKVYYSKQ
jgi:hypothetical protein